MNVKQAVYQLFNIQGLQVNEESLKVRNVTRQSGLTAFLAI